MARATDVPDPVDPRAPSQAVWDELSSEERARVVSQLPSEVPRETAPEGDPHRDPKERAVETLREYFRRLGRRVYLSAGLPALPFSAANKQFSPEGAGIFPHPSGRGPTALMQENRHPAYTLAFCGRDAMMETNLIETKRAWQQFVQGGELSPGAVREHIYRAWKRCEKLRVDPYAAAARKLEPTETSDLLDRNSGLVDAATPYLQALSLAAGSERHAAMLADGSGVVTRSGNSTLAKDV